MKNPFKELITKGGVAWRKFRGHYPKTVDEVMDKNFKYKKEVIEAMKTFKAAKPWRGDIMERARKLHTLNIALSKIYDVKPATLILTQTSGFYSPKMNVIALNMENPSVLTFLHEFGHRLGKREWQTCQWSLNLFKKIFPVSFEKANTSGHLLIKQPDSNIFTFSSKPTETKPAPSNEPQNVPEGTGR